MTASRDCDRLIGMRFQRPRASAPVVVIAAYFLTWLVTAAPAVAGQAVDAVLRCPVLDVRGAAADPDLYCIELIHAPDFPGASGTVELTPSASPFGAAVTVDGHHRFDLAVHLAGLPDPAALGDYAGYVAWAATPRLRPIVNLGSVANGRTTVGPVDLDKFLVLVTAESDPAAAAWEGRIVLRGTSAGMRMEPEDLLALTGMVGDAAPPPPARGWRRPPMHPSVAMMPGVGRLTPPVDPFLPSAAGPLPPARPREIVRLGDGGTLDLEAGLVQRTIDGRTFTMYGFNGQYPGPLIQVPQDATITVNVTNRLSLPTAVHWHGIRLENRFDGVPGLTQDPIEPGETFQYRIHFPDAGLYWYHPHHREDVQQDLGLYGNLQVEAADPEYFGPANREQVLMLDDLLVDAAGLAPFGRDRATHAMMGRFGNLLLVNGEPDYRLTVDRGEVVRFFLTNVSNTRTFNVSFGEAAIKLVASDIGKFERQAWVDSVVIAPAERYIVEVRFDAPGEVPFANRVQAIDHVYGNYFADDAAARHGHGHRHAGRAGLRGELPGAARPPGRRGRYRALPRRVRPAGRPPPAADAGDRGPARSAGAAAEPGPFLLQPGGVERHHAAHELGHDRRPRALDPARPGHRPGERRHRLALPARRRRQDPPAQRPRRGARHAAPGPHPRPAVPGARAATACRTTTWSGRTPRCCRPGSTADLLLELSNPGRWMLHCHIAEHLEAGMKLVFDVAAGRPAGRR